MFTKNVTSHLVFHFRPVIFPKTPSFSLKLFHGAPAWCAAPLVPGSKSDFGPRIPESVLRRESVRRTNFVFLRIHILFTPEIGSIASCNLHFIENFPEKAPELSPQKALGVHFLKLIF